MTAEGALDMKVWLPFVDVGSGAAVSTRYLARGLRDAGVDVVTQPLSRGFEFAPSLLSRLRSPEGTDVVLTNTWSGFAFKRPDIALITVDRLFVLDPVLDRYKTRLQRIYHQHIIRRYVWASVSAADYVVTVSEYSATVMSEVMGIPKPKVIMNAVDTSYFCPGPADSDSKRDRPIRLLYVGNLTRRKGSDMLAPIMARLGNDFELHYTSGLRPSRLGGASLQNMRPLGQLSQEQVRDQYRNADLLLFPSRGEGLPRAVMESMACGTPVVAAKVSSLPEAVNNNVGRLCPVDDAAAFADTVREISTDRAQLAAMRQAARQHAVKTFGLERMVDEYKKLMASVTERSQGCHDTDRQ